MRCLKDRPPASDLFGIKGRRWLADQQLAVCERETVDAGVRQVDFLDSEIAQVERPIAADALASPEVKRLMTVPGVNVIVAATFMAAVGDIRRFPDRRKLTAYLGLDPASVSPAPDPPTTATSPSKAPTAPATRSSRRAGRPSASPARSPPSISASPRAADTRSRSSPPPASSPACSRAYSPAARPTPTPSPRSRRRRCAASNCRPPARDGRAAAISGPPTTPCAHAERALAAPAELAYRRNVADWQATRPATPGASARQGHASTEPSKS